MSSIVSIGDFTNTIWAVKYCNADSWHSTPNVVAIFDNWADGKAFCDAQDGYGFDRDWFIEAIPFNLPATKIKR